MTQFRKSGLRMFIRIDGDVVTSVLNREKSNAITIYDSAMMAEGITNDSQQYPVCTEQEFKEAFNEALSRIQNMEIK
jgi:hypothetical protein